MRAGQTVIDVLSDDGNTVTVRGITSDTGLQCCRDDRTGLKGIHAGGHILCIRRRLEGCRSIRLRFRCLCRTGSADGLRNGGSNLKSDAAVHGISFCFLSCLLCFESCLFFFRHLRFRRC